MATSTGGTAVSQAQAVAKSVCDCLKTGAGVAEAVATAASSGNAQTAAQAIAEAVSGGALICSLRHMFSTKLCKGAKQQQASTNALSHVPSAERTT